MGLDLGPAVGIARYDQKAVYIIDDYHPYSNEERWSKVMLDGLLYLLKIKNYKAVKLLESIEVIKKAKEVLELKKIEFDEIKFFCGSRVAVTNFETLTSALVYEDRIVSKGISNYPKSSATAIEFIINRTIEKLGYEYKSSTIHIVAPESQLYHISKCFEDMELFYCPLEEWSRLKVTFNYI